MERTATKSVGPIRNTIFEKALGPRPTKSFPAKPKIVLNRISDHKHFFSQTSNTILRGVLAFLYKKMPLGFSHCFIQLFVHRGTLEKNNASLINYDRCQCARVQRWFWRFRALREFFLFIFIVIIRISGIFVEWVWRHWTKCFASQEVTRQRWRQRGEEICN